MKENQQTPEEVVGEGVASAIEGPAKGSRRGFLKGALGFLGLATVGSTRRQEAPPEEPLDEPQEGAGPGEPQPDEPADVGGATAEGTGTEDVSFTEEEAPAVAETGIESEGIPWVTYPGQANNAEELRILAEETTFAEQRLNEYFAVFERINHPELNRALAVFKEAINAPRVPDQDRTGINVLPSYLWNEKPPNSGAYPPLYLANATSGGIIFYQFIVKSAALEHDYNGANSSHPILRVYAEIASYEKEKERIDAGQRELGLSWSRDEATRDSVIITAEAYGQASDIYGELLPHLVGLGLRRSAFWDRKYDRRFILKQGRDFEFDWRRFINKEFSMGVPEAQLR